MDSPIDSPIDSTSDLALMEKELERLQATDPADIADRATLLADALAKALDELDDGVQT